MSLAPAENSVIQDGIKPGEPQHLETLGASIVAVNGLYLFVGRNENNDMPNKQSHSLSLVIAADAAMKDGNGKNDCMMPQLQDPIHHPAADVGAVVTPRQAIALQTEGLRANDASTGDANTADKTTRLATIRAIAAKEMMNLSLWMPQTLTAIFGAQGLYLYTRFYEKDYRREQPLPVYEYQLILSLVIAFATTWVRGWWLGILLATTLPALVLPVVRKLAEVFLGLFFEDTIFGIMVFWVLGRHQERSRVSLSSYELVLRVYNA